MHFATEEYVEQNGGKIDKILLNEVEQEIVDKAVNLTIDKTTLDLSNVDNTSDLDKPISTATQTALNTITEKIPNQASATNQLADKDFVNSSINSYAATFKGSYATKADLDAIEWQTTDNALETYVTNNDYAYVEADGTKNNEAWRYIYVKDETTSAWQPQFKVNDTPFTAEQLAAINSGVTENIIKNTESHLSSIENPHQVTKEQVGLGNVDNTADLNKPISNAVSNELKKYLPLTAGSDKKLTGALYFDNNKFIRSYTTSSIWENLIGINSSDVIELGDIAANIDVKAAISFRPAASNATLLGTSESQWREIYGTTIYQNRKQVANADDLSAIIDANLSSDSKTLTITKRNGTSFDFQGGGASGGSSNVALVTSPLGSEVIRDTETSQQINVMTRDTSQIITAEKKFDNIKANVSGSYRVVLTSPVANQTEKRYLLGVPGFNSTYSNTNESIYMQDSGIYSGSFNTTSWTIKEETDGSLSFSL